MILTPDHGLRRRLNGLTLGLGAFVILMGTLAWLAHRNADVPVPPLRTANASLRLTPAPVTAPVGSAASASDQVASPAADGTSQPQVAAIVNEPGIPERSAHATAQPLPRHSVATQPAASAAPPITTTARHAGQATASVRTQTGATNATMRADNHNVVSHKAAPAAAPTPAQQADTDVTLLTALVAHASNPVAVVSAERSRDIVERHDGDSTASLLQRCKMLGPIEGMLCRSRICSGRWDDDSACRTPMR